MKLLQLEDGTRIDPVEITSVRKDAENVWVELTCGVAYQLSGISKAQLRSLVQEVSNG